MNKYIRKAFVTCGGAGIARLLNRAPRILFYHSVDNCTDKWVGMFTTPIDQFEKEIIWLKKTFDIISIEEFHRRFVEKEFSGREMVLTFDDGFKNCLTIVEPILSKHQVPSCVFISTDHISNGMYFPTTVNRMIFFKSGLKTVKIPTIEKEYHYTTDEAWLESLMDVARALKSSTPRKVKSIVDDLIHNLSPNSWNDLRCCYPSEEPMTWSDVRELAARGVTIGGHCKEHISVVESVPDEIIRDEIIGSKEIIEQEIQRSCDFFAYPSGHISFAAEECVRKYFKMGFTTNAGLRITPFLQKSMIPRIPVGQSLLDIQINTSKYPNYAHGK